MEGKLFELTLHGYIFPVLTINRMRAYDFFRVIFPDEDIIVDMVIDVETVQTENKLEQKLEQVKDTWDELDLLNAEPGTIKFSESAIEVLLTHNDGLLTNI